MRRRRRSTRAAVAVAALLALLASALLWFPLGGTAPTEPSGRTVHGTPTEPSRVADPPSAPTLAGAAPAARGGHVGRGARAGTAPEGTSQPAATRVAGRLRVLDHATQRWTEDGTGTLEVRLSDGGVRSVEVKAGAWSIEVVGDVDLHPVGGTISGREIGFTRGAGDEGVASAWEGAFWPSLTLRVVDRDTRADLEGLQVFALEGHHDEMQPAFVDTSRLGAAQPSLIRGASASPVALGSAIREQRPSGTRVSQDGSWTVWAIAPGRAWGRLELDSLLGGDRTLALGPGGAVSLSIVGLVAGKEPYVVLDSDGETDELVPRAGQGTYELAGLVPGAWTAKAQWGHWWERRTDDDGKLIEDPGLGSVTFDVPPAGRTTAVLQLLPPTEVAWVPFRGTVELMDPNVDPDDLWLWGERLDAAQTRQERRLYVDVGRTATPDRGTFDFGLVVPGRYEVSIDDLDYALVVVGERGVTDAVLRHGERDTLHVTTVDAKTGAPVTVPQLEWIPSRPWLPSGGHGNLHTEAMAGPTAQIRVPRLPIRLWAPSEGLWRGSVEVAVSSGPRREATLRLVQVGGIRVKAVSSDDRPLEGAILEIEVEPVSPPAEGDEGSWCSVSSSLWCTCTPGRYRVVVSVTEEFAPVDPFEVDLVGGVWLDRTIRLVRRP